MTEISERPADPAPPPYPNRTEPPAEELGELATGLWRLGALVCGIFALGLWAGFPIVIVILALVVMIFFHELGHYLTAKRAGMKVTEFFIGFGPRIWSYRRGETEYGLKVIPAGAYVRIIGMSNLEEVPPEDEMRTYRQKSYPRRLSVAVAGSAMHFLMALVCLFLLLGVTGVRGGTVMDVDKLDAAWDNVVERAEQGIVGEVVPGEAAEAAGLQAGDQLVSIDGEPVDGWESVAEIVQPRAGEDVEIVVERDGETVTLDATVGTHIVQDPDSSGSSAETEVGFLGVGIGTPPAERLAIGSAVVQTGREFGLGMAMAVDALGSFFTGGIGDFASQVANGGAEPTAEPVTGSGGTPTTSSDDSSGDENRLVSIYGAARIGEELTKDGMAGLLLFLVNINIFVGLFNLVPLLPLDGGHVAVATYERIRSRNGRRYMADVSRLLPLTYAVVMVLVVLGLSSLYLDIVDPISLGG